MTTPLVTIYNYLNDAGLIDEWVDSQGVTQPKPVLQMRELEEGTLEDDQRCLLIIKSGSGGGDRYVSTPTFTIASIGKVNETSVFAEEYANKLYSALLLFQSSNCVISIEPMGDVSGLMKTGANRPVHDMEFSSKIDSGLLG